MYLKIKKHIQINILESEFERDMKKGSVAFCSVVPNPNKCPNNYFLKQPSGDHSRREEVESQFAGLTPSPLLIIQRLFKMQRFRLPVMFRIAVGLDRGAESSRKGSS